MPGMVPHGLFVALLHPEPAPQPGRAMPPSFCWTRATDGAVAAARRMMPAGKVQPVGAGAGLEAAGASDGMGTVGSPGIWRAGSRLEDGRVGGTKGPAHADSTAGASAVSAAGGVG